MQLTEECERGRNEEYGEFCGWKLNVKQFNFKLRGVNYHSQSISNFDPLSGGGKGGLKAGLTGQRMGLPSSPITSAQLPAGERMERWIISKFWKGAEAMDSTQLCGILVSLPEAWPFLTQSDTDLNRYDLSINVFLCLNGLNMLIWILPV